MFHATVHVTRVEEWCVEAETAEEAHELLTAGGGPYEHRRCGAKIQCCQYRTREATMSLGTILLIVLILLLIGALPTWPYSTGWGYYPSGGFGLVVVILLILLLMGRL
jgi:hypothetical protein